MTIHSRPPPKKRPHFLSITLHFNIPIPASLTKRRPLGINEIFSQENLTLSADKPPRGDENRKKLKYLQIKISF
jgi:hypothetical protein